jgi:hypothetical protein
MVVTLALAARPPRPARQKYHHGAGDRTFSHAPGYVLHHHPVFGTLHSPGRVAKAVREAPQRHKLPASLRQAVISWGGTLALPAASTHPCMRLQLDFDLLPTLAARQYSHREQPPDAGLADFLAVLSVLLWLGFRSLSLKARVSTYIENSRLSEIKKDQFHYYWQFQQSLKYTILMKDATHFHPSHRPAGQGPLGKS